MSADADRAWTRADPAIAHAQHLQFSDDGLGWFKGTVFPQIWAAAVVIAFGHSLLSMSGFETLAQIYREIAYPKLKNLKITGNIVCIYALVCTGVITLFAGMIIPDKARARVLGESVGRADLATWWGRRCCCSASTFLW